MTEAILLWMASVIMVLAIVWGITAAINTNCEWMDGDDWGDDDD